MRLAASLRYSLYFVGALAFASGVAWLGAHDFASSAVPGKTEVNAMRIHGAAAMALLVLVGAAAALHSTTSWRQSKNRLTGAGLGATLLALALTGYLLYYDGDDSTRAAVSLLHWALGLALLPSLALHLLLGRRRRRMAT